MSEVNEGKVINKLLKVKITDLGFFPKTEVTYSRRK